MSSIHMEASYSNRPMKRARHYFYAKNRIRAKHKLDRYHQERRRYRETISTIEMKGVPLFYPDSKWGAAEEVALLTSLELWGYGNWEIAANMMSERFKTEFTTDEIRDHFISTYLDGKISKALENARSSLHKCSVIDHTTPEDDAVLLTSDVHSYKNVPPKFLKEIGYLPLREDFKEEYDPAAEELLYYSEFRDVEEYDKHLNLILVDVYRHKLRQRYALKKAIRKYRLVEDHFASSIAKHRPKRERRLNRTFQTLQTFLEKAIGNERNHNFCFPPQNNRKSKKVVPEQKSDEKNGLILPQRLRPRRSRR